MKVLIATGLYPPESGGPATFAKLAEEELRKKNFEVAVVPFSKVRHYPKFIKHIAFFFLLFKNCKDTDVVLSLDAVSVGVPAWLLAKLKRKPLIVRLGGDYAWEQGRQRFGVTATLDEFSECKKVSLPVRLLRFVQTKVTKSADRVIAPSKYLKSVIARWGVAAERIEVIYSVSDVQNETETTSQEINLEDLTGRHPVVLSVSRLVPWKGFIELIEVIANLKQDFPDIKLLIGGDGPQKSVLEQTITELGLSDTVTLLGRLQRSEMKLISQQVDMFVLNTEYEGFSHLLVEFMALGVPVITTDVGGNIELIAQDNSGILVHYNDKDAMAKAIATMAEDEDLRLEYIAKGKERVKEFSKEKSMSQLTLLLEQMINRHI